MAGTGSTAAGNAYYAKTADPCEGGVRMIDRRVHQASKLVIYEIYVGAVFERQLCALPQNIKKA